MPSLLLLPLLRLFCVRRFLAAVAVTALHSHQHQDPLRQREIRGRIMRLLSAAEDAWLWFRMQIEDRGLAKVAKQLSWGIVTRDFGFRC